MEFFLPFKEFDTVKYDTLLAKLEHSGYTFKLFTTYLTKRIQYTAINNNISETLPIKDDVPQGTMLRPILLLQTSVSSIVVTYSDMHYFADDTKLIYASKSIKDISRKVNFDLKT